MKAFIYKAFATVMLIGLTFTGVNVDAAQKDMYIEHTQTTISEAENITDQLNAFTDNMIKTGSVTSEQKYEYDNEITLFEEKLKNDLSISSDELQNYKKSVNRYQNNVIIYANNYKSLPAYLTNYANKSIGNYSLDGMAIEVKNDSYVSIDLKDAQYTLSTGDVGSYNRPYVKIKSPQGATYFFLYNEDDDTYFVPTNKGMELHCKYDGEKTFLLNTEKRDSLVENEAMMLSDEFWNVQISMGRLGFTYKDIKLDNDASGTEYITLPNPQNAKVTTQGTLSDENMKKAGIENYAVITVGTNSYYWNRQTQPDKNIKFDTDNSQMIIEYDGYNVYININGNSLIETIANETSTENTTVAETNTESTTTGTMEFTQITTVTAVNNEKNSPSSWAKDEITEAVNKGILPGKFQSDYTKPITREDFCSLIINTLMVQNPEILNSADTTGIAFTDTSNCDVKVASALGIVAGVGNNKFNPNGEITRQEAARMLYMAATVSERIESVEGYFNWRFIDNNKKLNFPYMFDDISKFECWASLGIQYCYQNEIMFGVGQNNFDPLGSYTREQAYLTALRLYKKFNGENIESDAKYDINTGKFIYMGIAYDKVYTTYKNEAIVLKNNTLSLIDENGNTIIGDISKNISALSNLNTYVYDCYGDLIIVMQPLYNRAGDNSIYGYEAVLYKATGESLWSMPNNLHFTESGEVVNVDENNDSYGGDNTKKTLYDLLAPEKYKEEGYSTEIVAIYKK